MVRVLPVTYSVRNCKESFTFSNYFKAHQLSSFKKMKKFVFLALLSIIGLSLQDILRLECKSYADFNIVLHNLTDVRSTLKTIVVKGLRKCLLKCVSLSECKAVNYKETNAKCELIGRGLNKDLIEKSGWVYLTTDEKEKKVKLNLKKN